MKVRKLLTIFLLIVITMSLFARRSRLSIAKEKLNEARNLHRKYIKYERASREIRELLDKAYEYIRRSRARLAASRYNNSIFYSNKAIDMLKSIPQKIQALGGVLPKRVVQSRIILAQNIFTSMKRYNLRSTAILKKFTVIKNKIKFAQMKLNNGQTKQANKIINQAVKQMLQVPKIYIAENKKITTARNDNFRVWLLARFTKRYFIRHNEARSRYRTMLYYLKRSQELADAEDFNGARRARMKSRRTAAQIRKIHIKKERELRRNLKKCQIAVYALQYALVQRKLSSEQLRAGQMTDLFLLARRWLSKAKHAMNQNRCDDAYKAAMQATQLFARVRLHRQTLRITKSQCQKFLKEANRLYQKAKKARLPFDVVEQLEEAEKNINNAKKLISKGKYGQAYNVLKGTVMLLKAITN